MSMAESTAEDHLTVDSDADVVGSADLEDALGITVRLHIARVLDRRTQCMTLSASIKHSSDAKPSCDPQSSPLLCLRTNDAFSSPAQW